MASYLIMTPPGAAADDERARFVADGFSWTAFFFPALWLFAKRAWLLGIPVAVLQVLLISLSTFPGGFVPAFLMHLALSLLVSLEGPLVVAWLLSAKDWTLRRIVPAQDLETAERIYYSSATGQPEKATPLQSVEWSGRRRTGNSTGPDFFESYGER
ncbi:DUF2628 domain-containing protein [Sinorhizobium alkalisoli]|uniref:Uncharacterized protein n=1 Tax=Sinorhizobium alkalisoli TaxID=1752398 RepID=A0A1E3VBZ9_9HYPH|nr:DUF2628 domain-containing protein [Sinorhizobium alkalisoli]MCA1493391.1 DUF2628 domain-containing protein [Ensifer sp. NBAIM29]MCG5484723.1 DUF2628 domain-containing protein [Sinorhizobium meliloti]ODR91055.1 hypothetical protein A8M32_13685 [Sinorhizobium alkalisoli]QFI68196.1 hypothetical protein EKH55_3322 [Sinorhizobium alkalisoli]